MIGRVVGQIKRDSIVIKGGAYREPVASGAGEPALLMFQDDGGINLALFGGTRLVCLGFISRFANLEAAVTRVARVKDVSGVGQACQGSRQVPQALAADYLLSDP